MHQFTIVSFLLLFLFQAIYAQEPVEYVDPFIGTGGHGHTYPGASMPFGMVQLSPDTRLKGWDGCSGYHYSDSVIYGFSHTHLSGTGVSDYCDILFMPYNKKINIKNIPGNGKWVSSKFSHEKENAEPGFYSVELDNGQHAGLTVTKRCGFHQYFYQNNKNPKIFLDLEHRDHVLDSKLKIISNQKIEGYRISKAWAKEQHVYFAAEFSKPMANHFILANDSIKSVSKSMAGNNLKAAFYFGEDTDTILLKVGISAVSIENAKKNLQEEVPGWDFGQVRKNAEEVWNKELEKIMVKGGSKSQKAVFYTALYHSFLNPNLYQDVNGDYRGRDLETHHEKKFTNYTVFSLWDTYRATHPLFTLLQQEKTNDFIRTFIKQYEQGGELPVWELAANETDCMIGYHSIPVIADAYLKGITDFDVGKAFEAMKASAEQDDWGIDFYRKYGFVPADKEAESVSKTLEYAYDDWCIAQMAKKMGKTQDYKTYIYRAQYYKNIFDPKTHFARAKVNNQWYTPFDPKEVNNHFTEANSWQYSFYVPQDISGLIKLHGSMKNFEEKLDRLFTEKSKTTGRHQVDITGLIGQYAHGNEPSHHMAYLYNFIGKPWKSQEIIHKIMNGLYTCQPDGLCGNEDCGQMSSWYVFSALGFFPVTPASNDYIIGTPAFEEAIINLENGKTFTIKAKNLSEDNSYIQSVSLNGKPHNKSFIKHEDMMNGGELVFLMGDEPNKTWAQKPSQRPVSAIKDAHLTIVPFFNGNERAFKEVFPVILEHPSKDAEIFYSLNNKKDFRKFVKPFTINQTTKIYAYAKRKGIRSHIINSTLYKIPRNISIKTLSEPSEQYTAGGNEALIDGIRGGKDFRLGDWQGYQYDDFIAVVDLEKAQQITKVAAGFLQDQNSWIFMPVEVEFYVSNNGKDFKRTSVIENDIPQDHHGPIIKDFEAKIGQKARYIKIVAKNLQYCPSWHKGYPFKGKAFIFVDEIIVE